MAKLISQDKILHFLVCLSILLGTYTILSDVASWHIALFIGVVVAVAAGLGKECFDKMISTTGWDNQDLIADGAGIALGIICVIVSVLL